VGKEKCLDWEELKAELSTVDRRDLADLVESLLRSAGIRKVTLSSSSPDGSYAARIFMFEESLVKYISAGFNNAYGWFSNEYSAPKLSELHLHPLTLYQLLKCYTRKCYSKNIYSITERVFGPEPDTIYCY